MFVSSELGASPRTRGIFSGMTRVSGAKLDKQADVDILGRAGLSPAKHSESANNAKLPALSIEKFLQFNCGFENSLIIA